MGVDPLGYDIFDIRNFEDASFFENEEWDTNEFLPVIVAENG